MSQLDRPQRFDYGPWNGGYPAQTRRSWRLGRTAESGGFRSFPDRRTDGEVAPISVIRAARIEPSVRQAEVSIGEPSPSQIDCLKAKICNDLRRECIWAPGKITPFSSCSIARSVWM